jgi:phage tail tape-measure protein
LLLHDSRIDPAGSEAFMTDKNTKPKKTDDAPHLSHPHGIAEGAIAGEVVGAILGSAAGPAGLVAGMVIGAAAGSLVGGVLDREAERAHKHDEELDEEIGVASGNLGIVRPPAPAEKT